MPVESVSTSGRCQLKTITTQKTEGSMKTLLNIIAALSFVGIASSAMAEQTATKEVVVAVNNVYVPAGFDSTTDSYVVVSGVFPNGCYKWKGAEVTSPSAYEHDVTSKAVVSQGMCIQVLVPFSTDVKLGKLQTGKHTLKFMSNDGTYMQRELVVE